jgi:hypothetical protein
MKRNTRLYTLMLCAAITIFAAGCYTVISTTAYRGGMYGSSDSGTDQPNSARVSATEKTAAEPDSFAERDDSHDFGLKPERYYHDPYRTYSETEQDSGMTVINNYYYYNYPDPYFDSWGYRTWYGRTWYDPWYWDGPFRPSWRSGIYLGFGYYSNPWYDPWAFRYDGYWVDPWCWYDPWYSYSWWNYPYFGGYAGWNDRWYDHGRGDWRDWGGGGGGGGGGSVTNEPRKYRNDRLAGFGTSRDAGGVTTVGDGSSGTTAPERGVSERAIRGGSRDGFGTTDTRRRGPAAGQTTGTEKRTADSPAQNAATPSRRNPGTDVSPTHQRVRSGEMIRLSDVSESGNIEQSSDAMNRSVLRQGDARSRMNDQTEIVVKREVSPDISDSENLRSRSRVWTIIHRSENAAANRSSQVQESPITEKPAVRSATREQASSERSPSYTPPSQQTERSKPSGDSGSGNSRSSYSPPSSSSSRPSSSPPSSGSSRPSYSPPSRGSSRTSGSSGGGGSRPSGSQSGSRRR